MYTIGRQLKPLAANWILFLIAWQHNSHQKTWITNDSCLAFAIIIFNWVSVKRDDSLLFNERKRTHSNSRACTEWLVRTSWFCQRKYIYRTVRGKVCTMSCSNVKTTKRRNQTGLWKKNEPLPGWSFELLYYLFWAMYSRGLELGRVKCEPN